MVGAHSLTNDLTDHLSKLSVYDGQHPHPSAPHRLSAFRDSWPHSAHSPARLHMYTAPYAENGVDYGSAGPGIPPEGYNFYGCRYQGPIALNDHTMNLSCKSRKIFNDPTITKQHLKSHCEGTLEAGILCPRCGDRIRASRAKETLQAHFDKLTPCDKKFCRPCEREFKDNDEYQSHVTEYHYNVPSPTKLDYDAAVKVDASPRLAIVLEILLEWCKMSGLFWVHDQSVLGALTLTSNAKFTMKYTIRSAHDVPLHRAVVEPHLIRAVHDQQLSVSQNAYTTHVGNHGYHNLSHLTHLFPQQPPSESVHPPSSRLEFYCTHSTFLDRKSCKLYEEQTPFQDSVSLRRHLFEGPHHPGVRAHFPAMPKTFHCSRCNMPWLTLREASDHMNEEKCHTLKCEICWNVFLTEQVQQYHKEHAGCQAWSDGKHGIVVHGKQNVVHVMLHDGRNDMLEVAVGNSVNKSAKWSKGRRGGHPRA